MPMYMTSNGDIFNTGPISNLSFRKDSFQCDSLMTPVIQALIKKGYRTRACCEGHVSDHFCINYDQCVGNPNVTYESIKSINIDLPYIMFEDDVVVPIRDLPSAWEWECTTPRSLDITDENVDTMMNYTFTHHIDDESQIEDMVNRGFNLSIRLNSELYREWFELSREDFDNFFGKDPYRYYEKALIAIRGLYYWATNLPDHRKIELSHDIIKEMTNDYGKKENF